jgi:predicted O-methyltransferase YrrM
MKPAEGLYRPMRMTSLEAAAQYEDESIDFLMLDGSHETEDIIADIKAFLPKMKNGGVMTGDDVWEGTGPLIAAKQELTKYNVSFTGTHFYAVINK